MAQTCKTDLLLLFQPEDYWFSAPKKGIMVFALPGEPGLTELAGDFKVHFHDGQGDFYWYNQLLMSDIFLYFLVRPRIRMER